VINPTTTSESQLNFVPAVSSHPPSQSLFADFSEFSKMAKPISPVTFSQSVKPVDPLADLNQTFASTSLSFTPSTTSATKTESIPQTKNVFDLPLDATAFSMPRHQNSSANTMENGMPPVKTNMSLPLEPLATSIVKPSTGLMENAWSMPASLPSPSPPKESIQTATNSSSNFDAFSGLGTVSSDIKNSSHTAATKLAPVDIIDNPWSDFQ
jgi:hypothetical protein